MLAFLNMAHAQVSLPYSEGFENGLNGWTLTDCQSNTGLTNSNDFVHSGDSTFTFHWTISPPQYLISPEFTGTNNHELNVSFYYKFGSAGSFSETFQVGYSTNSNDISDFTFGEEITAIAGNDWEIYTEAFPSGTKYVAIKCTSNDALYLCLDDFVFTKGDELLEAELTVHDATTTNNYVPVYGTWADAYQKCEMVYPATELSAMAGGEISGITYYLSSPASDVWTGTWEVFMYEVDNTTIDNFYGEDRSIVYTGALDGTGATMTINFDTPYTYNGGNLLVGVYQIVPGNWKSAYFYGETVSGASVQGYSSTGLDYISATQRNFLPKTTFTYLPPPPDPTPILATLPDPLDLGYRPASAWMRPYTFILTNTDVEAEITGLELQGTGSDALGIDLGDLTLPFTLGENESVTLGVNWGNQPSIVEGTLNVSYPYGNATGSTAFPITAQIYDPAEGDVWELPKEANSFPYTETLNATALPLYDNYFLPNANIPEGNDVVYKLEFDHKVLLSASVTEGDNGKVALYAESFNGEGGPDANNSLSASSPFEAQIGEGTNTSGRVPMYYLYDNSLSLQLFLANELLEAGANTTPMSSISWYSQSTYGYLIHDVSIWMANVSDNTAPSSSPLGSSMTLVFQGDFQEVVGWNEFVFNQNEFAWDGNSNLLVMVQMNNGDWGSSIQWYYHDPGFQATAYTYRDNTPYDAATNSFSMTTTSTLRANTLFKAGQQRRLRDNTCDIDHRLVFPGTYYLAASSTSDEFTVTINAEALPCPEPATLLTPTNGTTDIDEANTTLSWKLRDYAIQYCLLLGTDPDNMDTLVSWTHELSEEYLITESLDIGTTYYWQVGERNDDCTEGVFSDLWSFSTNCPPATNLYISRTGWAMWDDGRSNGQRQYEETIVTLTELSGDTIYSGTTDQAFMQLPTDALTDSTSYYCMVTHVYAAGPSNTVSQQWLYQSCDHYDGTIDPTGILDAEGAHLSWTYPDAAGSEENPFSEQWLYYDDGTYATSVGAGGNIYWATMFPADLLAEYGSMNLSKVALHSTYECAATLNVFLGGDTPGGSPVATKDFNLTGDSGFMEIELDNPVLIDGTENLWIMFYQNGTVYPADACNDTGYPNNRWVSLDGETWSDLADAGLPGYSWMIRAYIESTSFNPVVDPLGTVLFRDGEWLGFTTGSSFVDTEGTIDNTYELRMVYDGAKTCPNRNIYYSMGCPQAVDLALQQYQIDASANPTEGGDVNGVGSYGYGTTCSLAATPSTGYHFVNWTVNGSQVSTSETLSFTVTQDSTFVGHFEINSYEIEASANPEEGGTISGAGTYNHFEECTLIATPNEGYHFVNWTEDGTEVATTDTLTFVVSGPRTLVAHFEINSYEITVSANPEEGGTLSGDGTYNHFEECTLTATVNMGYIFLKWTKNGALISHHPTHTFTVTEAGDYVAHFAVKQHLITALANPTEGGTVTGSGSYAHGDSATLEASANEGYTFLNWTLDGEEVSSDPSYTFTVTAPGTYVAQFSHSEYTVTVSADPTEGGTVTGEGTYPHGTSITLEAIPNEGYAFLNWTLDGEMVSDETTYHLTVTEDGDYTAHFEMLMQYNITLVQVEGGTLEAPATAYEGQTVVVTAEHEAQYRLVSLFYYTDDPENVTAITLPGMTFVMPAADVTVSGEFQHFDLGDVNLDGDVNILDVLTTLNHIIGNNVPFEFEMGDMNGDGIIDISDALAINGLIHGYKASCGDLEATFAVVDGTLFIDADMALAGYQFTLDAAPASIELPGFSTMGNWVDGKYVQLVFSLDSEREPGCYPVLNLGNADLDGVILSTKEGCPVRAEEGTLGIAGIDEDRYSVYPVPAIDEVVVAGPDITSIEVVNLMGQRLLYLGNVNADATRVNVTDLAAGCYLFRIHANQGTFIKTVTVVR